MCILLLNFFISFLLFFIWHSNCLPSFVFIFFLLLLLSFLLRFFDLRNFLNLLNLGLWFLSFFYNILLLRFWFFSRSIFLQTNNFPSIISIFLFFWFLLLYYFFCFNNRFLFLNLWSRYLFMFLLFSIGFSCFSSSRF